MADVGMVMSHADFVMWEKAITLAKTPTAGSHISN